MATSISGDIGGHDITGSVVSLKRTASLCSPGQHLDLHMNHSWPYTDTAQECNIYEDGIKVLHGYVVQAAIDTQSATWKIGIDDDWTRLTNYFIPDNITTETIQTTAYWAAYILDLCGATYNITGTSFNVPPGVQIGLRTVADALNDILAFASWYAFPDKDGVIQIGRIQIGTPTHSLTNFIDFNYKKDDEFTRTTVKVFGMNGTGLLGQNRVFSSASVSLPTIIPDRITAVGSSMIATQAEADRVASYLISELGKVSQVITGRIEGNPAVRIGDTVSMSHTATDFSYSGTDVVTSLEVQWDDANGYTMNVTMGERCPRISGWSYTLAPIYAGTAGYGIYKSSDGGADWMAVNTGLPASGYVRRMGFNALGEGMAIVNGGLYYNDGTDVWLPRALTSPVNMANDNPAVGYGNILSVDALGTQGAFTVMTMNPNSSGSNVQQARTWIYTCANAGANLSDWSSVELYNATTQWHNIGADLIGNAGIPIAVATSGSIYAGIGSSIYFIKGTPNRIRWNPSSPGTCIDPGSEGILDCNLKSASISGYPEILTFTLTLRAAVPHTFSAVIGYGKVASGGSGSSLLRENRLFWGGESNDQFGPGTGTVDNVGIGGYAYPTSTTEFFDVTFDFIKQYYPSSLAVRTSFYTSFPNVYSGENQCSPENDPGLDGHGRFYLNAGAFIVDQWPSDAVSQLVVPWLSQLGVDAAYAPGDCGTACVAMWLHFLGGTQTVDQVSIATGQPAGFTSLSVSDIITAAAYYGLTLVYHTAQSFTTIQADIAAGHPCIALIDYGALPPANKYDPAYTRGHFIVIVGIDDLNVTYHDPYWLTSGDGAYKKMTLAQFDVAWATINPDFSTARNLLRYV